MINRIMIVEDNLVARMIMRDILEAEGFTVVAEATGCDEAVAKYGELQPDLVFMDIVLKDKNGIEAAGEILSRDRKAKIIMVSVLDDIPLIQAAFKLGVVDFIRKPYDAAKIMKSINDINGNARHFQFCTGEGHDPAGG